MGDVEQASSIAVCLSVCVQRAALRPPTPYGRTLSRKRFAARLSGTDSSPKASLSPLPQIFSSRLGSGPRRHTLRASMYRIQRTNLKNGANHMFNKVILIGRLGKNAEAKTAQNKKDYVVLSVATSESWKNDKGEYDTRTEWHRVYAWGNLTNFAKTLLKGQLISLEGKIKYREVEQDVEGTTFKHTIAEIHASSMKRLSKVEADNDPFDGVDEE
jgi:single-strand DNA-binding protein